MKEITRNNFRNILLVFFSNLNVIWIVVGLFFVASIGISLFAPKTYRLEGAILVKSKRLPYTFSETGNNARAGDILPPSPEDVALETRIITNYKLIEETVAELRKEGVIFESEKPGKLFFLQPDSNETVKMIQENLSSVVFPGSMIIDVFLYYPDPQIGKLILDRILTNYLRHRMNILTDTSAVSFFETQILTTQKEMASIDSSETALVQRYRVADLEQELEGIQQILVDLTLDLEKLKDQLADNTHATDYIRRSIIAYRDFLEGKTATTPPPVRLDNNYGKGYDRLNDILMNLYVQLQNYSTGSEQMKMVARRIISELENFAITQEEVRKMLVEKSRSKGQRIKYLQDRALELRSLLVQLRKTSTDSEIMRRRYESFANKRDLARLESASEFSQLASVQVFSRPRIPDKPLFPRPILVIPIGLLAGIFFALIIVWIRELFENTFKSPQDVERYVGIPVVLSILEEKQRNNVNA